ncbi:hypothetical protein QVD99_008067 [Batrachochytrium dendrobatidis]|nr:hypothetical protein QVD99_008067 [Batrachochytrium dendrobatidis]
MPFYTAVSLLLLANAMSTAAQGCMDTFSLCLVVSDQFEAATCVPQKLVNQTLYTACECYRNVNRDLCYNQCSGNATLQAERLTTVAVMINQTCSEAGLNPHALPQPPPWQRFGLPSSTVASTPPTNTAGTAGAPVAGTANTPAKAAAAGVHESGVWMSAMTASLLCLVTAIMV